NQDEFVRELGRLRITQHEAFLVIADGGADDFVRDRQETFVERPHKRYRPFDEAPDFGQQPLVFHQIIALRESKILGVSENHVGAPRRVENHFGLFELCNVVLEVTHLDRTRRHEAMPARFVTTFYAVDIEGNDSGLLGFRAKSCDDRMKRAHPAEPARAPPHGLWPWKAAHYLG